MSAKPTPIEREHYGKLVGRNILAIHWQDFEGQSLPILILSGKDTKGSPVTAAVMCDPEGNGPGHLEHSL
jgi:hypothetical protein